jgi:UDP-3-O-[3-hydroxymyristoyl] N-acetylglucosamine deacetylase
MVKPHLRVQTTLRDRVDISGIGVHSGRQVSLALHPNDADTGITFFRTRVDGHKGREIPAHVRHVSATDLCTTVGVDGVSVATIEHLMATLRALDIDNALVEIDGPEVPVMDGSAHDFIDAVDEVGAEILAAPRRYVKVLKPVRVEMGRSFAEFRPYDGMRVEIEIDFANPLIGRQSFASDVDAEIFRRQIARARTFGFLADIEGLWAKGFALGASLENALVFGDDRVINPGGMRFADECVRHKALDAIGDLALAGAPILGAYRSFRGGHKLNVMALDALFADEDAWTWVEMPVRRESGHADLPIGVSLPAFGPNRT